MLPATALNRTDTSTFVVRHRLIDGERETIVRPVAARLRQHTAACHGIIFNHFPFRRRTATGALGREAHWQRADLSFSERDADRPPADRAGVAEAAIAAMMAIPAAVCLIIGRIPVRSAFGDIHLVERRAQPLRQFGRVIIRPEMHEERPRLVVEHVIVDSRYLDAVFPQRLQHRVHFRAQQNEIAGDGRLAAARRLKVDGNAGAHGRRNSHAGVADDIRPRDGELIDATGGRALLAQDLFQLRRIDVRRRSSGSSGGCRAERRLAGAESLMEGCRQLNRIALTGDVHVEGRGLRTQQMIVQSGDVMPFANNFAMTGLISFSAMTRSPMTMLVSPMDLKASQPPSASAGLISTPST